MRVSIDSGGRVSLGSERHAAISVPRPGQEHDERRLRLLHVLQPLLGHAHRAAVGRLQHGQRGRRKTPQAVLRRQTGTILIYYNIGIPTSTSVRQL